MEWPHRLALLSLLAGAVLYCDAGGAEPEVTREQVDAHVREQFRQFGPQSKQHEYFGYVYSLDGSLTSAVVRGRKCDNARSCGLNTAGAAKLIPGGARVLAEWHTHPHRSSARLSKEDVGGAHANRHIPGYTPYYSTPDGKIYAWDPRQEWVPGAMSSLVLIGNYRSQGGVTRADARRHSAALKREIPDSMSEPRAALFETCGRTFFGSRHPVSCGREVREQLWCR